jgi:hypothetical protein
MYFSLEPPKPTFTRAPGTRQRIAQLRLDRLLGQAGTLAARASG